MKRLSHDEMEQLGELLEKASLEAIGQLTRFVYRKALSPEEAAKLAIDIGSAFSGEFVRRVIDEETGVK